jgi:hypothetical protein
MRTDQTDTMNAGDRPDGGTIVAVARRLAVALWRYLKDGMIRARAAEAGLNHQALGAGY